MQLLIMRILFMVCLRRKIAVGENYIAERYSKHTMSFWTDLSAGYEDLNSKVGSGIRAAGGYLWDRVKRVDRLNDKLGDVAEGAVNAASGAVDTLGTILSGKSNVLLYIGLGVLTIVVLPVVLQKVL
jgi:hypothetical protein